MKQWQKDQALREAIKAMQHLTVYGNAGKPQ
jgi:hypothetical protein